MMKQFGGMEGAKKKLKGKK